MCGRGGELFIQISSKSCIKCGLLAARKKLLQFSPAVLLPTLPNFAHFAHLRPDKLSKPVPHREDGGDSKSKTLLFNSDQAGRQDSFYHIHHAEHCCRCGMPRFYQGGSAVAVQEGILTWLGCTAVLEDILTWEKHSQAFQEDKGKSQLAIWVTWLDGFRPAFFLLVFVTGLQRWQQLFIKQKTRGWIHKISKVTMPD